MSLPRAPRHRYPRHDPPDRSSEPRRDSGQPAGRGAGRPRRGVRRRRRLLGRRRPARGGAAGPWHGRPWQRLGAGDDCPAGNVGLRVVEVPVRYRPAPAPQQGRRLAAGTVRAIGAVAVVTLALVRERRARRAHRGRRGKSLVSSGFSPRLPASLRGPRHPLAHALAVIPHREPATAPPWRDAAPRAPKAAGDRVPPRAAPNLGRCVPLARCRRPGPADRGA
jgi:hypothetical protein